MFLKCAGSFAPHTPAPLRGFLWRSRRTLGLTRLRVRPKPGREGGSPHTSANPSSGISRADVSFDMMALALPPA